jgi:hypothetical protein
MVKPRLSHILNILLGISTVGSFVFGFYAYYVEKAPRISIYKISEINVLEINRSLDNLKILFNDEDIQKGKKDIRIINIKIQNDGKKDITQDMYANELDWGIVVNNSTIVQARLVESNNTYLKDNIKIEIIGDKIKLNKIILEAGSYFTIELVLLTEKGLNLEFGIFGKIAGIINSNIKIIENAQSQNGSFWDKLFYGTVGIHFARAFLYFLILVIGIIIIVVLISLIIWIGEFKEKHERKLRIRLLVPENEKGMNFDLISKMYISYGYGYLNHMVKLLNDPVKLENTYKRKHIPMERRIDSKHLVMNESNMRNMKYYETMKDMIDNDFVTINQGVITVDSAKKNELEIFLRGVRK